MSASATTPAQQARQATRVARRHQVAERRARDARLKAEQQERRDEAVAPRAQRLPVLDRHGQVIRGARIERSGVTFVRSNPIRNMVLRGQGKENPLLTKRHSDAADRLLTTWAEAGEGITMGVAVYDAKVGGSPDSGTIADGVLRSVHR